MWLESTCAQGEAYTHFITSFYQALGVKYRRSPVMAIGREVYVDTRIMIAKLEELFPASAEHPRLSMPETTGGRSVAEAYGGRQRVQ